MFALHVLPAKYLATALNVVVKIFAVKSDPSEIAIMIHRAFYIRVNVSDTPQPTLSLINGSINIFISFLSHPDTDPIAKFTL